MSKFLARSKVDPEEKIWIEREGVLIRETAQFLDGKKAMYG
jgi:hypothetical protein